jgi:hypothetical protein
MTLATSRHLIMVTLSAISSPWSNRCTSKSTHLGLSKQGIATLKDLR